MPDSDQDLPATDLPESMPAIVLEGCSLFPHGILPLYIFEPRYRKMLASALDSHRMFCVATVSAEHEVSKNGPDRPVYPYSTAGLIRACVGNEDGTSNLILQGIQRIHLKEWIHAEPFPLVKVEPVKSNGFPDEASGSRRGEELRTLVGDLATSGMPINEKLHESIKHVDDPEVLADLVAYNFVSSVEPRQALLATASVGERFDFLIAHLEKMRALLVE
ncbi:MAG: LON peptidase substrate-binding domain-containing protein [Verrucomicrobiota bacterium]